MRKQDEKLKETLQSIDSTLKRIETTLLNNNKSTENNYGCVFSSNNSEKILRNITFS